MAAKKKTGAKRKPAKKSHPLTLHTPRLVLATALRSTLNMVVVATVSATVLGGLLAVKHFGV